MLKTSSWYIDEQLNWIERADIEPFTPLSKFQKKIYKRSLRQSVKPEKNPWNWPSYQPFEHTKNWEQKFKKIISFLDLFLFKWSVLEAGA